MVLTIQYINTTLKPCWLVVLLNNPDIPSMFNHAFS